MYTGNNAIKTSDMSHGAWKVMEVVHIICAIERNLEVSDVGIRKITVLYFLKSLPPPPFVNSCDP